MENVTIPISVQKKRHFVKPCSVYRYHSDLIQITVFEKLIITLISQVLFNEQLYFIFACIAWVLGRWVLCYIEYNGIGYYVLLGILALGIMALRIMTLGMTWNRSAHQRARKCDESFVSLTKIIAEWGFGDSAIENFPTSKISLIIVINLSTEKFRMGQYGAFENFFSFFTAMEIYNIKLKIKTSKKSRYRKKRGHFVVILKVQIITFKSRFLCERVEYIRFWKLKSQGIIARIPMGKLAAQNDDYKSKNEIL